MSVPAVPPAAPAKPSSIPLVFGIVNACFGVFGLVGLLLGIVSLSMTSKVPNPVLDVMRSNAVYHSWTIVQMAVNGLLSSGLAISGVGLILRREWGRLLALGIAVGSLLMLASGALMNVIYLIPPLVERYHDTTGPEQVGLLVGILSPVCAIPIGVILPGLTLFLLTRPEVKAALT